MTSLSFPDVNVWLALLMVDPTHRAAALRWWDENEVESIAFCRHTQLSVLRLLTAPAAMNGRPLTVNQAWTAYDRLFDDPRVTRLPEPTQMEEALRRAAAGQMISPKIWADAYLTAFAARAGATVVTFDQALAKRSPGSRLIHV